MQILFDKTVKKKSETNPREWEYREKAPIYHKREIFLKFKTEQIERTWHIES